MNERFDLVFLGELVPGSDLAQTKKNIANLFKIGPEKVDMLFSGKPVNLKKNLDADTANTYRVAIKKAGARVNLVESKTAEVPAGTPTTQSSVTSDASDRSAPAKMAKKSEAEQVQASVITVQAQRGNLVSREELGPEAVAPDIPLDHLSLRDQQGNLVDGSEIDRAEAIEVDIPDVDISSLQEYLLKPEERVGDVQPEAKLVNVDYSLAEPGATLGVAKEDNTQPPNTDHIHLADQ